MIKMLLDIFIILNAVLAVTCQLYVLLYMWPLNYNALFWTVHYDAGQNYMYMCKHNSLCLLSLVIVLYNSLVLKVTTHKYWLSVKDCIQLRVDHTCTSSALLLTWVNIQYLKLNQVLRYRQTSIRHVAPSPSHAIDFARPCITW